MIERIVVERATGNGKYGDVIDAAVALGEGDYGSAANALVVMARQSMLFQATDKRLKADSVPARADAS